VNILFSIYNISQRYKLDNVQLRISLQKEVGTKTHPSTKDEPLLGTTVKMLDCRGSISFPLTFKADYEGNVYLIVDILYTSDYFKEQLNKFIGT